jgi:hypothetical protein
VKDPSLFEDLDALIEPTASGDPDSPLRWTTKSVRSLADALRDRPGRPLRTHVALRPLRARETLRTAWPLVTLRPLDPNGWIDIEQGGVDGVAA